MLVPTPPAQQPAALMAPVEIAAQAPQAATSSSIGVAPSAPVHTSLAVRRVKLNVLGGQRVTIFGALRPGLAGAGIVLQALAGHDWRTVARTRTGAAGRYRLRYTPARTVSERVRLRFAGSAGGLASSRGIGRLNVYRLAEASWYGGGGGLACGGTLTSSTLGVANKTLPCGTLVTLHYRGRTVRVPVVDRGPFVAGRDFDLTEATKRALGFGDLGQVWSTR